MLVRSATPKYCTGDRIPGELKLLIQLCTWYKSNLIALAKPSVPLRGSKLRVASRRKGIAHQLKLNHMRSARELEAMATPAAGIA
jgi:hypothetical protein